ncbi:MAG: hypothetical protein ABSF53_24905 [Terracidiphilus sp.]
MSPEKNEHDAMNLNRIDEILASETELAPSSGFLSSVMERVNEEASAPPPIPFPWKRALPGFVLAAGVFGWGGVELVRAVSAAMRANLLAIPHSSLNMLQPSLLQPMEQAGWVALALGTTLVSWLLGRRLTGRSRLL